MLIRLDFTEVSPAKESWWLENKGQLGSCRGGLFVMHLAMNHPPMFEALHLPH